MKKIIEVMIDIETMSLRENAAIVSIGVVPFDSSIEGFSETVDLLSCILEGMDVDRDTCLWWSNQSTEAKKALTEKSNPTIRDVIETLEDFFSRLTHSEEVELVVWSQGLFDIAVLQNAFRLCLGKDSYPWSHKNVRDARTFILEGIKLINGEIDNPYSVLPKKEGISHSAIDDATNSIVAVKEVRKMLTHAIETTKTASPFA